MKHLFAASLLYALLLPAIPASANTSAAESCLNKQMASDPSEVKSAQIVVSVTHDGYEYHRIRLVYPPFRGSEMEAVIYLRTSDQGGCEQLLSYLADSFPEENEYREKLGSEVFDKIVEKMALQRN
ncbi:hypothetical protein ACSYAD_33750 [Acaryochloris marina NIES-2412]|uniref:hypothetical protein n=1 Tax=Acaryochloris marina TaxID=155978 RepID=UPI004058C61E